MMKITKETLDYLAHLSRLKLTEAELAGFTADLNSILDYMAQLKTLDLSRTQPCSHAIELKNVFRKDQMRPSLKAGAALSNAPQRQADFFKVPKIIK